VAHFEVGANIASTHKLLIERQNSQPVDRAQCMRALGQPQREAVA